MSPINDQAPEPLTRDQLIAALDKEITDTSALQASTGRTKWTLLITLAALIGLGLQAWENSKLSGRAVVALCLAMAAIWDFTRVSLKALDASPSQNQGRHTKFFVLSDLLGTFRSTLLAYVAREALIVFGAFWLADAQIWPFKSFSCYMLIALLAALIMSFFRLPMHGDAALFRKPVLAFGGLTYLWHATATFSISSFAWKLRHQISPAEVKIAAIITAASYLVVWLAEESIPESRASQLRNIRQNLSFARISLEEALNQTDFLLVGMGIAQVLRRPFEELTCAIEKVRGSIAPIEAILPQCRHQALELKEATGQYVPTNPTLAEFTRAHLLAQDLYSNLGKNYSSLLKQVRKFKERCNILALLAPDTKKDADPLLEKLSAEVAFFHKQFEECQLTLQEHALLLRKQGTALFDSASSNLV